MTDTLTRQARRMYGVFAELLRRYQFRDRDQVCCHGLSVSQCYTLELLADGGPRPMGDLANEICLKISTATRVVDHLVASGLAVRLDDPHDRRVCRVEITKAGRDLVARVRAGIVTEYEAVLKAVPVASREAVIDALSHLLLAFKQRQCAGMDRCKNEDATNAKCNRNRPRRKRKARNA
jgi:MarR family 2-MHQ and catechol resistance regulon transcriptional repressor